MHDGGPPGRPDVFNIQEFIRKVVPFAASPLRNGQKSGRGQYVFATFAAPNVDTPFTLSLGHLPEQYVVCRASAGGSVYDGSNGGTDWTPNSITLRATAAGTFRIWVA